MTAPIKKKRNRTPPKPKPLLTKEQLAVELLRRRSLGRLSEEVLFDRQLAFINDPAKRKVLFTPRRSGKSTALGIYMLQEALKYPRRKFLYLGLSKTSAENTIWGDIIEKELDRRFGPAYYNYNRTTKVCRLPNGSQIIIGGLDSSPADIKKYLGGKYHLVVIDECQSVRQDLRHMVESTLGPAMLDYSLQDGGIIVLAGTPGTAMGENFWFQLTRQDGERYHGWSVHEWTMPDNPFTRDEYFAACEERAQTLGPNFADDPDFKRDYLGRWVTDLGTAVYRFDETRNIVTDESTVHSLLKADRRWTYIIGVDFGWSDPCGFVVTAYSATDRTFYIVESRREGQLVTAQIAAILTAYQAKYRPVRVVMDTGGIGKITAESMRAEYALPVVAADRQDKALTIGRMNSDFFCGRIRIIRETNRELIEELSTLVVDRRKAEQGVFKEDDRCSNHCTDAALYAFKDSLHFHGKEAAPAREPDLADEILLHMKRSARPQKTMDRFEREDERRRAREIVKTFRGVKI